MTANWVMCQLQSDNCDNRDDAKHDLAPTHSTTLVANTSILLKAGTQRTLFIGRQGKGQLQQLYSMADPANAHDSRS